ncbi:deoxycytidine triphosphate deaminase [Aminobacter anthyllidis]|uniref:Deoxycytidine triphosphate deaminase n=1 Tax=Aminobacter anthyllidis TaxID=1035067 RepID=A0A9X1AGX4_9HYPH|nr:deoxycytidine triphosphate deaminase [Aminobacter anthyllidis]MBT1159642.1 deoxycytidine triphosphate deaminase [Aminobacter anthyllidis]
MAFWSGETLKERLSELVNPADPECIDCAAYTLKVGPEYYVTPTDRTPDPKSVSLKTLQLGEAFAIPPGQFAWVLTHEVVTVPKNALAFISIRARIKWKGLINVSGFHVDPGFSGRLTFSVFNAGPVPIHLRHNDPTFLIWFADIDRAETDYAKAAKAPVTQLDLTALNQVAGEVYSLQGLADRIRSTEKDLSSRITALERANGVFAVAAGVVLALAAGLAVQWIVREFSPPIIPVPTSARAALLAPLFSVQGGEQ